MRLPADPPPRLSGRGENIVPMINVVFLLLVFFLLVAEIAPRDPVAVSLPEAQGAERAEAGAASLYLTASGEIVRGDLRGEAALADARQAMAPDRPLVLRADAAAPADQLARLLTRLGSAGPVRLAVVPATP